MAISPIANNPSNQTTKPAEHGPSCTCTQCVQQKQQIDSQSKPKATPAYSVELGSNNI